MGGGSGGEHGAVGGGGVVAPEDDSCATRLPVGLEVVVVVAVGLVAGAAEAEAVENHVDLLGGCGLGGSEDLANHRQATSGCVTG